VDREDSLLRSTWGRRTKQVQPKTLNEEKSGTYPYNFSKGDRHELWEDEIVLIKLTAIRTASPQSSLGTKADNKREWVVSTMCLCFLSATPFCLGVSVHEV